MKKYFIYIIIVAFFSILNACTEKNEPVAPPIIEEDNISGKTIKYSVQVLSNKYDTKSTSGLLNASVSLAMNDTIIKHQTDSSGIAYFSNLAAGTIAVNVTADAHYSCEMLVELAYPEDSTIYDSDNFRNAASRVMLPAIDAQKATITGQLKANFDLQTPEQEIIQKNAGVYVNMFLNTNNYNSSHEGIGAISSLLYNMPVLETTTQNGIFSLVVPGCNMSLSCLISADDMQINEIQANGTTINTVYIAKSDTIPITLPKQYWHNILYTPAP